MHWTQPICLKADSSCEDYSHIFTHIPPATQAQRQFLLEVFEETQKNDESY